MTERLDEKTAGYASNAEDTSGDASGAAAEAEAPADNKPGTMTPEAAISPAPSLPENDFQTRASRRELPLKPFGPRTFGWRDWWAIAKGTGKELGENEVSLIAAGVAFYAFLALFPLLAALVALYGFVSDPATIEGHLDAAASWAPPGAVGILEGQIDSIMGAGRKTLGYASLVSVLLMLWTAKAGVSALARGLNIVFKVPEKRGFISGLAMSYMLTIALVLVALIALTAVVVLPGLLAAFPVPAVTELAVRFGRWPIVFAAVIIGMGLLYRFGPAEPSPRFAYFSIGALIAIALWVGASAGFSYYVRNFANYNGTYGSLGAMVGLLMWFYLSAFIILLGGEINAQIEFRCLGEPGSRERQKRSPSSLARLADRARMRAAATAGAALAAAQERLH
ncbi:MAG: YihY/virulence factor BrkB family protein [Pseudomonadota bacterium]